MKKLILASFLTVMTAMSSATGIASGQSSGTNYPMAEDIKSVCSTQTNPITNVKSEGSLDNIFKIAGDKNVQYGIIQVDALVYQQGLDPNMMKNIVGVFPFFSTEFHLIVREDSKIKSFADLQGKNVVEGPEGSGTWVSVQVMKATTGVNWNGFKMSQLDGLKAVTQGVVDAEFVVAGRPITMLKGAKGIRLVPISHPALDNFKYYTKTMIPTNDDYTFQKTAVQTYKVDNILATYAFKNQYQKEIGELVTCITKNMGALQKSGHAKWKDVDPSNVNRIAWPTHPAAIKAIKAAQ